MENLTVAQAEHDLARLIDRATAGEEIVIGQPGRAAVRLVPVQPSPARRQLGTLSGRITVPADFDAPLPDEILAAFEGR